MTYIISALRTFINKLFIIMFYKRNFIGKPGRYLSSVAGPLSDLVDPHKKTVRFLHGHSCTNMWYGPLLCYQIQINVSVFPAYEQIFTITNIWFWFSMDPYSPAPIYKVKKWGKRGLTCHGWNQPYTLQLWTIRLVSVPFAETPATLSGLISNRILTFW